MNGKKKYSNTFTLYSATSITALQSKKGNDKYVLSQIIMDHEYGRLWIGFKNPLCLQSYNLHSSSKISIQNKYTNNNYLPAPSQFNFNSNELTNNHINLSSKFDSDLALSNTNNGIPNTVHRNNENENDLKVDINLINTGNQWY